MDLDGLVEPATLERMRRAAAGDDVRHRLRVAALQPGDVGVLRATVRSVAPARTFQRKSGSEGLVGRVTFDDGTGDVDGVLWDDQNRLTRDGTLAPGKAVEMAGVVVQEGWRGGIELSLETAQIRQVQSGDTTTLHGKVAALSDTDIIDGHFQAEVRLETPDGPAHLIVWDDIIKELRRLGPGADVILQDVSPHPLLDDWYLADKARLL